MRPIKPQSQPQEPACPGIAAGDLEQVEVRIDLEQVELMVQLDTGQRRGSCSKAGITLPNLQT